MVFILFSLDFIATFSEGSKPTYSILEFLKLLRNVPSFEPISINFESDFKNSLFIQLILSSQYKMDIFY